MALPIGVVVTGETRVKLKFEEFPQQAHDAILKRIREQTDKLAARIEAIVPRKTGRLASEITSFVDDNGDRIAGKVKVIPTGKDKQEAIKAIALEYGATGAFTVNRGSALSRRLGAPGARVASSYQRTANIAARMYMRGPLEAQAAEFSAAMDDAMKEAVDADNG